MVAIQFILILFVHVDDVAIGFALAGLIVVEEAVARDGLLLVDHRRAAIHLRLIGLGIEKAVLGVDGAALRRHLRRPHDMGYRLRRIVVERVGSDKPVAVVQLHVVIEDGLARTCIILSPVGHEVILAVDEFSALHEVGRLIEAVVGEAVGIERLAAMSEHHVLAGHHQFLGAVVGSHVASQRQCVALLETHVAEGLHRVGSLVVVGAVAP